MDGYAKITRLSKREDGRVLVCLTVGNESGSEDVEFLILDELLVDRIGELSCTEIELCTVGQLEELADVTAAFFSACASLAFSQCSSRAIIRKLLVKGFSRSASEAAVELCEARGFIDESGIVIRRAEIMVEKPWGRIRILAKLREEGYSDAAMDSVREYLDGVDFAETCARVILKKYRDSPEERIEAEKMYASLARLGFSKNDIREAIKTLNNEQ
jgi:SOS response regulatory protein OraA/RecX